MTEPTTDDQVQPALTVVHGNPTPEEIAALVAVLAVSRGSQPDTSAVPKPTGWSAYWRAVRAPLMPGPDAWRASGRSS
ncbi:MAG: acyl-CoA carboxylase subunit epsilon [Propionibacteriaceae bacterium]